MDKYYYDFQKDPNLVERFEQFMESIKERGMEKVSNIILRALTKKVLPIHTAKTTAVNSALFSYTDLIAASS